MLRCPLISLLIVFGFFAGWTVGSNIAALAGLEFRSLWGAFALGVIGAYAGWRVRRRAFDLLADPGLELVGAPVDPRSLGRQRLAVIIAPGAIIAAAGIWFVKTSEFTPLWASIVACAGLALALSARGGAVAPGLGQGSGPRHLAFGLLLATIASLYFFSSAPDGDDAFYLNLPVGLKNAQGPLFAGDTTLGETGWPLLGSNYKVEALPTLAAALSAVTGLPVIVVAHAVLPALWCVMLASAAYVMFFAFFRRDWLWGALLYVLLLVGLGWSFQSYGLHGIVRLFHGKAVWVSILAPLLFFVTYAALRRRSAAGAFLAMGLQISALGATANAIYLAPLAMGLVCAARFFDFGRPATTTDRLFPALFLATSAYNLLIGLVLLATDPPTPMQKFDAPIETGVWSLFSNKILLAIFVGAAGLAALAALVDRRWRFATLYAGAFFLFAVNPALWDLYSDYVTGNLSFRLFWAAPFPMLLAVGAMTLTAWAARVARPAAVVAALGLAVSPVSSLHVASFGFSPLKTDDAAYGAAVEAAREAGSGRVLAAADVARWLPTFEAAPRLVYVRADYLEQQRSRAPAGDLDWRMTLHDWVNGRAPLASTNLTALLRGHCVTTIILDRDNSSFGTLAAQLVELGAFAAGSTNRYARYALDQNCTGH
jgi:hypothetical protein